MARVIVKLGESLTVKATISLDLPADITAEILRMAKSLVNNDRVPKDKREDWSQELWIEGAKNYQKLSPDKDRMGLVYNRMRDRLKDYINCGQKEGRVAPNKKPFIQLSALIDDEYSQLADIDIPEINSNRTIAQEIMSSLTDTENQALQMYWSGRRSLKKIADATGLTAAQVRDLVNRIKERALSDGFKPGDF